MFEGYIFYAAVASTLFITVILGVLRATSSIRTGIVLSFIVFLPVTYFATIDLMSRPRPVNLMLSFQRPNVEKAKVLAVYMVENKFIMLLLNWDGLPYPRYFRFPWNKQMAEQISAAKNGARGKDGKDGNIEMLYPFDATLERRRFPWAHPVPQEQNAPTKNPIQQRVYNFQRGT